MKQGDTIEALSERIKELEKENHFYKCLYDAFPVNVFVKDTECRYTITNKICDMANGVERGGLQGKTDFDLQSSPEIAQTFYDDDQKIMREKAGSRMFTPTLCGDTVKYYDIFKEPILDENGNVLGILGMVVDPNQEVLSAEKEKINSDKYIEDYKHEYNMMFDYNLLTNEAIFLSRPSEYGMLPDKVNDLIAYMKEHEFVDERTAGKINELFEKIKSGQKKCSKVIQYYDSDRVRRDGIINITALYGKDGNASRAICVIRAIDPDKVLEEKRKIIIEDVADHFNDWMAQQYEKIIYASEEKNWYQFLKNTDAEDALPETGTFDSLKEAWTLATRPNDLQQLMKVYHSTFVDKTAENRTDINSIRIQSKVSEDEFRWKEITVLSKASEDDETSFIIAITDIEEDVQEENRIKRHETNKQIIDVLSTIVEYRDLESGEHIRRIEDLSEILLKEYTKENPDDGFTEEEIKIIAAASAMHDIGKIAISDTILLKPGKLTKEEFESMKEHTVKGSELVNTVASIQDKEYAKYCYDICRYHHERYDGKGYPDGLSGDEIPVAAQIVSVADVYDALVSKRCYKDAYSKETAYQMILNGECGTFSDKILQSFMNSREELEALYI